MILLLTFRIYFSLQLFETVKNQRGLAELMSHCKIVSGDVTQINLGISEDDRKEIVENVDIIYHMAATIRYVISKVLIMVNEGDQRL